MSCFFYTLASLVLLGNSCETISDNEPNNLDVELQAGYWMDVGKNILRKHVDQSQRKRNIGSDSNSAILVVGTGMSLTTIAAAGILNKKADFSLSFEKFPVVGFGKPYCDDLQVGNDVCTSTAYLCGNKGIRDVVGMTKELKEIDSIAQWAISAEKDVGIVTTSRLTQVSVASTYGHSKLGSDVYHDFAYQLIHNNPGNKFKVILGGGYDVFLPQSMKGGKRKDGKHLIEDWKNLRKNQGVSYQYVTDKKGLFELPEDTEYLLGLFNSKEMEYNLVAEEQQPKLEDMVEAAIKILSRNKKGYFLFVLGGRINDAHHSNQARLALDETIELSKAVEKLSSLIEEDKTLMIVTSDHGSTMSISGYPSRNNDILGISDFNDWNHTLPTISYANGPGYIKGDRFSTAKIDYINITNVHFKYPSNVPLDEESHGGEDVAIFAKGPYQEIFTGSYEMEAIPHLIGYAISIGPGKHSYKSSAWRPAPDVIILMTFLKIVLKYSSKV